jgi:hypothetical protein
MFRHCVNAPRWEPNNPAHRIRIKGHKMTKNSASLTISTPPPAIPADPVARTRELNDTFRRDLYNPALGTVAITAGAAALPDYALGILVHMVRCFEDFTEGDDPYGEHDFGVIHFREQRYFWKIDYYDRNMHFHSPNKSDSAQTHRVLTIMRADEY